MSNSGQREGAGQKEGRGVAAERASAPSPLEPPALSLQSPTPSSAKPTTSKSAREAPSAKPDREKKWVDHHIAAMNHMGFVKFDWNPTIRRIAFTFGVQCIASATGLTVRTVVRCYRGMPVRSSTLLRCAQAARIQGLGEPPGAPRLVRE